MISSHLSPGLQEAFSFTVSNMFYEFVCSTPAEHLTHLTSEYVMFDEAEQLQRCTLCRFLIAQLPFPFSVLDMQDVFCEVTEV